MTFFDSPTAKNKVGMKPDPLFGDSRKNSARLSASERYRSAARYVPGSNLRSSATRNKRMSGFGNNDGVFAGLENLQPSGEKRNACDSECSVQFCSCIFQTFVRFYIQTLFYFCVRLKAMITLQTN